MSLPRARALGHGEAGEDPVPERYRLCFWTVGDPSSAEDLCTCPEGHETAAEAEACPEAVVNLLRRRGLEAFAAFRRVVHETGDAAEAFDALPESVRRAWIEAAAAARRI